MSDILVTSDGLRLAWSDCGPRDALPVLCLSGLTRNSRDFSYLAPHLGHVRLVAMDYRGRGASDWAPDPATYNIMTEAADALALLDHLEIERAAILGTSRGGLIAMTLAATARHRLLGVCLNDVGPVLESAGLEAISGYIGKNPDFPTQAAYAAAKPDLMQGFFNVSRERWLDEVRNQTVEGPDGLRINYDPALATQMGDPGQIPDLWPLFDALVGMPVALIRGENSNLLSVETARKMQERMPGMIYAEVPDRGHVPFLDEPQALKAIMTWIKQCK